MKILRILAIFVLALSVAPAMTLADCGGCDAHDEKTAHAAAHECGENCTGCSGKKAEIAKLAIGAEGGCEHSKAELIAIAKKSGDAKQVALAEKAEGGCEHSAAELIAMMKGSEPSLTQVAVNAKGGCSKSAAKLIQMAKVSGNPKMAELAEKAEGGCAHSKAELIAMAEKAEMTETATK